MNFDVIAHRFRPNSSKFFFNACSVGKIAATMGISWIITMIPLTVPTVSTSEPKTKSRGMMESGSMISARIFHSFPIFVGEVPGVFIFHGSGCAIAEHEIDIVGSFLYEMYSEAKHCPGDQKHHYEHKNPECDHLISPRMFDFAVFREAISNRFISVQCSRTDLSAQ